MTERDGARIRAAFRESALGLMEWQDPPAWTPPILIRDADDGDWQLLPREEKRDDDCSF